LIWCSGRWSNERRIHPHFRKGCDVQGIQIDGAFAAAGSCPCAHAQLTVEITGAGANRIPVAIANFAGDGLIPQALTGVVRADLERSGLFKLVDPGQSAVPENAAIDLNQWKDRGADALALASILPAPGGRYEVRMRLYDIARQNKPDGMIFLFGAPPFARPAIASPTSSTKS
jgi:Tol biopolymer transport system component